MKNLSKKVLIGIALAIIILSAIMGITYSKYISKISGDGTFEVAKWGFKVNEETEEFATIKLMDTYNEETLINGKIAPGTAGSFDLVVDATDSEVGVRYEVDFQNEVNKPTNLKFKHGDKVFENIEEYEQYFSDVINANDTDKVRTLTVEWEWAYETGPEGEIAQNDAIDTQEGINALDYTFDVVVTGTQVMPEKV